MHFTGSTIMNVKKDAFLSKTKNKQSFIDLLSVILERSGCQTKHAMGDADVLIVQTTIETTLNSNTVLVMIQPCYFSFAIMHQLTLLFQT